jgi:hypothetical protein
MAMTGKRFEIELAMLHCIAAEWSKKKSTARFYEASSFWGHDPY